ncbi:ubiquitin-related domain-containing protein [Cryomyces antarcticus]|nr:hypothetical protein LTR04_003470 [Oleoguttula sp. CCFEE 6159]
MASADLSMLVDMGFEKEKAAIALKKGGNLQGAVDWLDKNQEKSVDDIKAEEEEDANAEPPAPNPGEEAKSLVCNDCGKKFRSVAQAEFHASKTEHVNFGESTEEIAPLTEEEKKARLEELRQKLAEKRAGMSEQDKIDRKRNEQIRLKSTKEVADIKEDLAKKEQIKEAQAKRREKLQEVEAKKRIQAKIAADKEERRLKSEREKATRAGQAPPPQAAAAPLPTTSGPVTSKPASAYAESRLRLQTPNGTVQKTFPVETTLFEVCHALKEESGLEVSSFTQNFPRKVYDSTDFGQTLKEAGLVPSAALIVQ